MSFILGHVPPQQQQHLELLQYSQQRCNSLFSAARVSSERRQVHLSFALYSFAYPTYDNHKGPVEENIAQFP